MCANERFLILAILDVAGHFARYHLTGQVPSVGHMLGGLMALYLRWDRDGGRGHLSEETISAIWNFLMLAQQYLEFSTTNV